METNFKEAYETLLKEYSNIRQQLDQWQEGGILWTWTDVHIYASDEMGISLSVDDCKIILDNVITNHDADQGITWLSFRNEIENYI